MDGNRKPINPNQAIFPIVTQDDAGVLRVIGTGFFVAPMGIFVTAAHVVADALDAFGNPTGPLGIFHFHADRLYVLRQIVTVTRQVEGDLAVGRLLPLFDNANQPLHNRMLRLRDAPPRVGDHIHTFAFSQSVVDQNPPKQHVRFNPRYFGGKVTNHFPSGRDSVMLPRPCFATSMVLLGGSSGGPVLTADGEVFGVNSTGYDGKRVSFVSCVSEVWDLGIDGIQLDGESEMRKVTLRELDERGLLGGA